MLVDLKCLYSYSLDHTETYKEIFNQYGSIWDFTDYPVKKLFYDHLILID